MFRNKFIRPIENSTYRIHDPIGIKLLNRMRAAFSHLREHKFRHNFADTLNPLHACVLEMYRTLFSVLPKLYLFLKNPYDRVT